MSAPRSQFVTVLAWIFIVLSAFGVAIGLLQNALVFFVLGDALGELPAQASDPAPELARFFVGHLRWFFVLVLAAMAFTLAASIGLLRRRNWARLAFIGVMLFGVLWNVLGVALQIAMMRSMAGTFGEGAPPEFAAQFEAMRLTMVVVGGLMALAFSALFGFIAWKLTRPAIRAEFTGVTR